MKNILLLFFICICFSLFAQNTSYHFDPNPEYPYGLPNPDAPPQILDWADLIGECQCKSVSRNADGTWGDTIPMTWRFKYIMNGYAVQDETLKADGKHSGSIRQFQPDSARWFVHYYSAAVPPPVLSVWEGNRHEDGNIYLYKEQKAPNGTAGYYKITFSNISPEGFNWLGEWVDTAETIVYPTWQIKCKKNNKTSTEADLATIRKNIKTFSATYMKGDAAALAKMYTMDGKVLPGNRSITEGREALEKFWTQGEDSKLILHEVAPVEIKIFGDYAYDFGHYSGKVKNKQGEETAFEGKYVIIWKRLGKDWKIYLDIWNRGV